MIKYAKFTVALTILLRLEIVFAIDINGQTVVDVNEHNSIQEAIDHVNANGGGVVYFPPGEYFNSDCIELPKSTVELRGANSMTTSITFTSSEPSCGAYLLLDNHLGTGDIGPWRGNVVNLSLRIWANANPGLPGDPESTCEPAIPDKSCEPKIPSVIYLRSIAHSKFQDVMIDCNDKIALGIQLDGSEAQKPVRFNVFENISIFNCNSEPGGVYLRSAHALGGVSSNEFRNLIIHNNGKLIGDGQYTDDILPAAGMVFEHQETHGNRVFGLNIENSTGYAIEFRNSAKLNHFFGGYVDNNLLHPDLGPSSPFKCVQDEGENFMHGVYITGNGPDDKQQFQYLESDSPEYVGVNQIKCDE